MQRQGYATPKDCPFLDLRFERPVTYCGRTYPSAENAFQSTRFRDPKTIEKFRYMPPETTAYKGAVWRNTVPDWEARKLDILHDVLAAKFRDPALAGQLKATGDSPIRITNYRHENLLGTCLCPRCRDMGRNAMGELLERIREELR